MAGPHPKAEARLVGFDDGPFAFGEDEATTLAGVMTRGGGYVEAVLCGTVAVDGRDATDRVLELVDGHGLLETAQAIAFDGGAFGGFNVIDLDTVHEAVDLPVVAVLRDEPDRVAVRAALDKHFDDADERYRLLTAQPVEKVELGTGPAYVRRVGAELAWVEQLLAVHTVRGRIPEPLRIAHLVATAMAEGRSRGA